MVIIRKAIKEDIPRILELYEDLMEEKITASSNTIQRVFAEIEALPDKELLIAEHDGLVVGSLFLQIVPNLSHNAHPWAILENMIVDSRYRRHGIGQLLIQHAAESCRKAGCYKIQLLSHIKRKEAHQFYQSLGFENSALGFRMYF
jgi:predicted N-acetyltransferase YhbS